MVLKKVVADAEQSCRVMARAFSPYDASRVLTQAGGLGWYETHLWRWLNPRLALICLIPASCKGILSGAVAS
jgi:hypothetical protein